MREIQLRTVVTGAQGLETYFRFFGSSTIGTTSFDLRDVRFLNIFAGTVSVRFHLYRRVTNEPGCVVQLRRNNVIVDSDVHDLTPAGAQTYNLSAGGWAPGDYLSLYRVGTVATTGNFVGVAIVSGS